MRWNQFIAPTPLNLITTIYIYLHSLSQTKNPKIKLPIYLLNPCGYDTCWYYYVLVHLLGNGFVKQSSPLIHLKTTNMKCPDFSSRIPNTLSIILHLFELFNNTSLTFSSPRLLFSLVQTQEQNSKVKLGISFQVTHWLIKLLNLGYFFKYGWVGGSSHNNPARIRITRELSELNLFIGKILTCLVFGFKSNILGVMVI